MRTGRDPAPAPVLEEELARRRRAPAARAPRRSTPRGATSPSCARRRDLHEPRIAHPLREQVARGHGRARVGDDPVAGQERDADAWPPDEQRPDGDEGRAAHRSRSGHRAASQLPSTSRRASARSGSRSGTSRRSTTRPASPPVARSGEALAPHAEVDREPGSRARPRRTGRAAGRRAPGGPPASSRSIGRLTAGHAELPGLAPAADAARDREGAEGHEGVGHEVAEDRARRSASSSIVPSGARRRAGVERHLDDARPPDARRRARAGRRAAGIDDHAPPARTTRSGAGPSSSRGRSRRAARGQPGAPPRAAGRRRPPRSAHGARRSSASRSRRRARSMPRVAHASTRSRAASSSTRPRTADGASTAAIRAGAPGSAAGLGPGAERAAHPDLEQLDPEIEHLGERGRRRDQGVARVGGAGAACREQGPEVDLRLAVRVAGPATTSVPRGSRTARAAAAPTRTIGSPGSPLGHAGRERHQLADEVALVGGGRVTRPDDEGRDVRAGREARRSRAGRRARRWPRSCASRRRSHRPRGAGGWPRCAARTTTCGGRAPPTGLDGAGQQRPRRVRARDRPPAPGRHPGRAREKRAEQRRPGARRRPRRGTAAAASSRQRRSTRATMAAAQVAVPRSRVTKASRACARRACRCSPRPRAPGPRRRSRVPAQVLVELLETIDELLDPELVGEDRAAPARSRRRRRRRRTGSKKSIALPGSIPSGMLACRKRTAGAVMPWSRISRATSSTSSARCSGVGSAPAHPGHVRPPAGRRAGRLGRGERLRGMPRTRPRRGARR